MDVFAPKRKPFQSQPFRNQLVMAWSFSAGWNGGTGGNAPTWNRFSCTSAVATIWNLESGGIYSPLMFSWWQCFELGSCLWMAIWRGFSQVKFKRHLGAKRWTRLEKSRCLLCGSQSCSITTTQGAWSWCRKSFYRICFYLEASYIGSFVIEACCTVWLLSSWRAFQQNTK